MNYPQVIAKAAGGEPLLRLLMGANERVAYLANPAFLDAVERGDSDPVGFPLPDVFEPTEGLYPQLRSLFDDGDGDTLNMMWELARPIMVPEHV